MEIEAEDEKQNEWSEKQEEGENQDQWSQLPRDVLMKIFKKILNVKELFSVISLVCHPWYSATFDPLLWKTIDMRLYADNNFFHPVKQHYLPSWKQNVIVFKELVDRSEGSVTSMIFSINSAPTDEDLIYISARSPKLKQLTLPNWSLVTIDGLRKVFGNWIELEYLAACIKPRRCAVYTCTERECACTKEPEIDLASFIQELGVNSKKLTKLKLFGRIRAPEAYSIATHIPQLQTLDLSFSYLCNEGLSIIIYSCNRLKHFNISHCYPIHDGSIGNHIIYKVLLTTFNCNLLLHATLVLETFQRCPTADCKVCLECLFGGISLFERVRLFWLYEGHGHQWTTENEVPYPNFIPFYVYTLLTGDQERFESEQITWEKKNWERALFMKGWHPRFEGRPYIDQRCRDRKGIRMVFKYLKQKLTRCIAPIQQK